MRGLPEHNRSQRYLNEITMAEDIELSIVIVNYMAKDYLDTCLKSIFREKNIEYEVIVVDNGSTDGSVEIVERDFPSVYVIKNATNLGFAKANNIAIQHTNGKYILLLNPDTELIGSCLPKLIAFMENNPNVSAAGCKILYPDGRIQISCGNLPTFTSAFWGGQTINILFKKFFPNRNFFGACGIIQEALDTQHEVETLLGACVILRKEVLEKLGLFDDNMFMYFEECDLFYRIKKAGGKIMYIPDPTIIHHAGGSSRPNPQAVSYYQKSQEYYLRKNFSLKNITAFRLLIMFSAILKSTSFIFIYPFCKKDHQQRLKRRISWYWQIFFYYLKMFLKKKE